MFLITIAYKSGDVKMFRHGGEEKNIHSFIQIINDSFRVKGMLYILDDSGRYHLEFQDSIQYITIEEEK